MEYVKSVNGGPIPGVIILDPVSGEPASSSISFESDGCTIGADGNIAIEFQKNGTITRRRSWTTINNPDGSSTSRPNEWIY